MSTPAPVFPAGVATDQNLKIGLNLIFTTLRVAATATDTVLFVQDASQFTANVLVSIDNEIVSISGTNLSTPSLTVSSGGRGFDGTTAASHAAGAKVSMLIVAWHHNVLSAEVKAIEQFIGPNGQNIQQGGPFLNAQQYNFAPQTPGGSLIAGTNVITLSPVPRGVNGTNTGYQVYISGGSGVAEACPVTGGTAVSGAPSGTLIVTCVNAHSGAWTLQSTSGGIQEAICDLPTAGGVVIAPKNVTLQANVVKAGKTQPSVWKLAGVAITGSFSVLEQTPNANLSEWVTGPHLISALLGTFNNTVAGLAVSPEAHDPFPASYGCGMAVGQPDPTKISMNQFFHGIAVDVHTSNAGPNNQNAAVLGFMSSHGGADPFGGDFHGVVPSTATVAPGWVIGVQAETEVDIAAPSSAIYPLLILHASTSSTKATSMIVLQTSGPGANLLMTTDNAVFSGEGIVLTPANDLNPLYRAFGVTNAAGSRSTLVMTKNGQGYFDSSVVAESYNFIASETGANNAIAGTFTNQNVPVLQTGLSVMVKLQHSLQAGPNTFNLNNTGAISIKSHFNPSLDIAKAYVAGAMFYACYDGSVWEDMSQ